MSVEISEKAVIGKNVELADGVKIAAFAVIEDNVVIGDNTSVGSHAYIASNTAIGKNCRIFNGASVGTIAQDLKYREEDASLSIGDRVIIREFVTINKGTSANNGRTLVGNDCALLAYCHVAHDCEVGDFFVASNNLAMAGHTIVGRNVICGGNVSIHQFTHIGDYSFIGANSYVSMDIVPYSLVGTSGGDTFIAGHNKVGLERNNFSIEDVSKIKKTYKLLFRSNLSLEDAKDAIAKEVGRNLISQNILDFIEKSQRGLLRIRNKE
jgi:UDP-N-acetylglucosamine acyltransferase